MPYAQQFYNRNWVGVIAIDAGPGASSIVLGEVMHEKKEQPGSYAFRTDASNRIVPPDHVVEGGGAATLRVLKDGQELGKIGITMRSSGAASGTLTIIEGDRDAIGAILVSPFGLSPDEKAAIDFQLEMNDEWGHLVVDVPSTKTSISISSAGMTPLQSAKAVLERTSRDSEPIVCTFWNENDDKSVRAIALAGKPGEGINLRWCYIKNDPASGRLMGTHSSFPHIQCGDNFRIAVLLDWMSGDFTEKMVEDRLSDKKYDLKFRRGSIDFRTSVSTNEGLQEPLDHRVPYWDNGWKNWQEDRGEDTAFIVERLGNGRVLENYWRTDGPDLDMISDLMLNKLEVPKSAEPYEKDYPPEPDPNDSGQLKEIPTLYTAKSHDNLLPWMFGDSLPSS